MSIHHYVKKHILSTGICAFLRKAVHSFRWLVTIGVRASKWCYRKVIGKERNTHECKYYCRSMMRSGGTLIYNIMRELLPHECIDQAHEFDLQIARGCENGTYKCIYSHRDFRDVIVSHPDYNYYDKEGNRVFDESKCDILTKDGFERFANTVRQWLKVKNILIISYDKLMNDKITCIKKIAQYLGVSISEERCTQIAEKFSIENMLAKQKWVEATYGKLFSKHMDPGTHIHADHIHGGKNKRWRTILTKEQQEKALKLGELLLIELGYLKKSELFE